MTTSAWSAVLMFATMTTHWAFFAAILTLLIAALGTHVALTRMRKKIAYGDGGDRGLHRAIRAHKNSIEQSIPFVICLAAYDTLGGLDNVIMGVGLAFVGARIVHAVGMLWRIFIGRRIGATCSFALSSVTAALVLCQLAQEASRV